ncbi:aldehyde dehydrogenase family protein [Frigidibacter albus]|uniref:Aldehyde dehydrogenase family protein n=1 Tax=Frigidibacter albus TaxID=1465486 RepID=A0A6L8VIQ6_9RHOB|nr:aldehyde dehydrogenase family protein [Frigidibacter albus]MZQ90267.1 aldehyde dehydrogenase family protein [Frigidibacter albus]NBE32235.1 aldehyde dehydrogenase family protein [Frigidibacter albus]GGH58455.1 NADP-dependent aldehyde dehydrogenase [Frigidibacter albus]
MPSVKEILMSMEYGPAPESAAEVQKWLAARGAFGHFIGGSFAAPGETFATANPATGEELAQVTQGTEADIAAAVAAARKAQPGWAALAGHERAKWLYAIARHVQKRERFLAVLETLDNGKPIREARDIDIPLVARHFYHHAGWAELLAEEFPGAEAHGVCGQIIPWNFPLLMLAWKIAPALAAGNTVVLKPAEYTPLTALAFAEICAEIGLPPGVVNIVTGDGETGAALVASEVDKIAFTGSTEVGRAIRKATAGTGKSLTLELGGKSPFIVCADADLDAAVEGVVDSIWFNQGQVCCAGSRILVAEAVEEAFTRRLTARLAKLRVGDPLDKSVDVGALVHPVQLARVQEMVAAGTAAGARLVQADCALPGEGCFYAPGFLTGVPPANPVADAEIFGPVATLTSFRTPDEAVELANATRYGLAASVWTENVGLAMDLAAKVKAGVVWVNSANIFDAGAAFGGMRESGFGREGGRAGLRDYLRSPEVEEALEAEARFDTSPVAEAVGQGGGIDRTAKMYFGGKQARPDSGQSYAVTHEGRVLGLAGLGSRKDIRNAVEAAAKAGGWGRATAHNRAQVLYYLGENLSARAGEFAARLVEGGHSADAAALEVDMSIRRAFYYAAQADKFDGAVTATKTAHVTLQMPEPFGIMGIICPDAAPLLGFVSLVLPAIAMGNRVVAVPAASRPLSATDLSQVLDCSDVPDGVVNIVTGPKDELAAVLARHDEVAALWYVGAAEGRRSVEAESTGNLKPVWALANRDWTGPQGQGRGFLQRATQVKTIWVPYGE